MVMVPEPAWLIVAVTDSGVEMTEYEVMVAPPLLVGAVKEIVAVEESIAVAVPTVGASGIEVPRVRIWMDAEPAVCFAEPPPVVCAKLVI